MNDLHPIKPHFDLERAIGRWRAPFSVLPCYAPEDVDELEWHLMDAIEVERAHGLGEQEAFRMAVARVGEESLLREQYLIEWKATHPFERYMRLIGAEMTGLESRRRRAGYMAIRAYSYLAGLAALVFVVHAPILLFLNQPKLILGRSILGYGLPIVLALLFTVLFNLFPFLTWTNRTSDWLRLIQAYFMANVAAGLLLRPVTNWSGFGVSLVVAISLCVGPVLWLNQVFRKRERGAEFELG